MDNVLKFERPKQEDKDMPDDIIRMTPVEEAKILYAAQKMGIPVDFPYTVVKTSWKANTTAHDFGIKVTEDGDVILHDDNLALIRAEYTFLRLLNKLFNFAVVVGSFALVVWFFTL